MAKFHLAAHFPGPGVVQAVALPRLTGTLEQSRAIINVISKTCSFTAVTSQNVLCEKGSGTCALYFTKIVSAVWTRPVVLILAAERSSYNVW